MSLNTKETPTGASTKAPYDGGTYKSRGPIQGTERSPEALIRRLKQEEKEMNTFIFSAGGFSFSAAWLIGRNIMDLQAKGAQITARHLVSQKYPFISLPVAILPTPYAGPVLSPSGSDLLRAVVYWIAGLNFCLTATFMAIFIKQRMQSYRVVLQSHSQPREKAKAQEAFDRHALVWNVATDSMYRHFQVSLVIFIIGHVNFFFFPVSPIVFVPAVVYGIAYVFNVVGLTVL